MIALYLVAGLAVFAAIRATVEKNTGRKLPYLTVMSFAIAGAIVLLLDHPLSLVAAAAYLVGSTLEANAIASTYAGSDGRNVRSLSTEGAGCDVPKERSMSTEGAEGERRG